VAAGLASVTVVVLEIDVTGVMVVIATEITVAVVKTVVWMLEGATVNVITEIDVAIIIVVGVGAVIVETFAAVLVIVLVLYTFTSAPHFTLSG
jgi:hypothetical protein